MNTVHLRSCVLVSALLGSALAGCAASTDCIATTTAATEATKVDLRASGQSSVLEARIAVADGGAPLAGRTLRFAILDDGAEVHAMTASSGDDGGGRVDLKRVDVGALAAVVRGDAFRASFAGDTTHCASSGEASFAVVGAPPGAPVPAPGVSSP